MFSHIKKLFYLGIFCVLALIWLLCTTTGLRITLWVLQQRLPALRGLTITTVTGSCLSPMSFSGLDLQNAYGTVHLEKLTLAWQPQALLKGALKVTHLLLEDLQITPPPLNDRSFPLPPIHLSSAQLHFSLNTQGKLTALQLENLQAELLTAHLALLPTALPEQLKMMLTFQDPAQPGLSTRTAIEGQITLTPQILALSVPTLSLKTLTNIVALHTQYRPPQKETLDLTLSDVLSSPIPFKLSPQDHVSMQAELTDFLTDPHLTLSATLAPTNVILPQQGTEIQALKVRGVWRFPDPALTFTGQGTLGSGRFTLHGDQDHITLKGENLKIYNTDAYAILATPDITLKYTDNVVQLIGTIYIPEARILLDKEVASLTLSNDLIFVDAPPDAQRKTAFFHPDLYLRLENAVSFKGHGLDAVLSGKLHVTQRPDGLLVGTGRLTIKEGQYRLQGKRLNIHHGRLLFPSGTLLSDPILDIRITQHNRDRLDRSEVGLYIQGTLQKPILHLYSNASLSEAEILSRLGLGGGLEQTTRLLSGQATPLIEKLQTRLGLEEFNLDSRLSTQTKGDNNTLGAFPTLNSGIGTDTHDTVFVVGKSLSKRLYLQYLYGILGANNTVRLNYSLGSHWRLGVETSTQEGPGADVTFHTETD